MSCMRHRAGRWGVLVGAVAILAVGGCPELQPGAHRLKPVVLVRTAQLEPPAVSFSEDVFMPAYVFEQPGVGSVAGFFVTVTTGDADALQARLTLADGAKQPVARVVVGADAAGVAALPQPFDDTSRGILAQHQPLFWQDAAGSSDFQQRVAVLVPLELLSGGTARLELFTSTTVDGSPIGPAALELARGFFYMAIIGDSVQWGNGLEERDKLSTLTIATLEQELGVKVVWQRYALSGAAIVPTLLEGECGVGCFGEVPIVLTSITGQVDQIERPDLMDLILMDGCINDVGVLTIVNPLTGQDQLARLTERFCRDEMTELLLKVRGVAPQARIVVTGYFPIVGPESDILALQTWTATRGLDSLDPNGMLVQEIVDRSAIFHETAHASLRAAVATMNEATDGAPVAFADPGFSPENAVFSPNDWLWSLTRQNRLLESLDLGLDLDLFPEDPLATVRAEICLDSEDPADVIACIFASIGHPNPTGARAYANAVIATLRDLDILPAEPG